MSNNRRWGGSREGAGRPNTKAKGTRSIRSYYDVQVPGEPRVALQVAATEVEVAATAKAASEKNAKEKAATDRRELIQMELRERREQDLRNQKNGLEVLAEAAATENNGGTTGFHIEEEEEESDHESDDESWDSDNEEEDDDEEESPDNEPRTNKKRRNRQAYKPQPGSDFHAYLNEIKTKILSGEDKEFVKGKHEYPPMKDPLVKPHNTNATDWYESQYQVYVWYPFLQYTRLLASLKISIVFTAKKRLWNQKDMTFVQCFLLIKSTIAIIAGCDATVLTAARHSLRSIRDFFRSFRL
jgi:hypothetical protein